MRNMSIAPLNASTARLISCSVSISSQLSVVKELVENSIDAGATTVFIRLENYGQTRIEVRDDGAGVPKVDVPLVGLANHTSKILNFKDIESLQTYGFRGQALHAICAISDVSLTTCTKDDEFGVTYKLNKEGKILSCKPTHHCVGTTVVVENLFGCFPVRRKLLSASTTALKTILRILRCYALAKPNLSINLAHNGSSIWRKCSASNLVLAAEEVLGSSITRKMKHIYWKGLQPPINKVVDEESVDGDQTQRLEMEVDMLLPSRGSDIQEISSNPNSKGSLPDYYLLINSRPVNHKKIDKLMHCWITRGTVGDLPKWKKTIWVLSIWLPPNQLDVNLEADKSRVLLCSEDTVLAKLEEILSQYYLIGDPDMRTVLSHEISRQSDSLRKGNEGLPECVESSLPVNEAQLNFNAQSHKKKMIQIESKVPSPTGPPPAKLNHIGSSIDNREHRLPLNSSRDSYSMPPSPSFFQKITSKDEENLENVIEMKIPRAPVSDDEVAIATEISNRKSSDNKGDDESLLLPECNEVSTLDNLSDVIMEGLEEEEISALYDAEKIFNEIPNSNDELYDLEHWSRGTVNIGEVTVSDPVKILQPPLVVSSSRNEFNKKENRHNSEHHQVSRKVIKNVSKSCLQTSKEHLNASSSSADVLSPMPNAYSQLGRRDMKAFGEFSANERPKILERRPGIKSAHVALKLAERWKSMSKEEQDRFASKDAESTNHPFIKRKQSCDSPSKKKQIFRQLTLSNANVLMPVTPVVGMKMTISMEMIKDFASRKERNSFANSGKSENHKVVLIGQLKPSGMWTYCKGNEVGILRHFALQELVVYRNLLKNHSIPLCPLTGPMELSLSVLGDILWEKLLMMKRQYDVFTDKTWITSKVIAKNGFRIRIDEGLNGEMSAVLTDVASVLPSYGIMDLKEILEKVNVPDSECKLSECRPAKVSNYLESEAIRMCRQSLPVMTKDELSSLLKECSSSLNQLMCLHNQPIFVPVLRNNAVMMKIL